MAIFMNLRANCRTTHTTRFSESEVARILVSVVPRIVRWCLVLWAIYVKLVMHLRRLITAGSQNISPFTPSGKMTSKHRHLKHLNENTYVKTEVTKLPYTRTLVANYKTEQFHSYVCGSAIDIFLIKDDLPAKQIFKQCRFVGSCRSRKHDEIARAVKRKP